MAFGAEVGYAVEAVDSRCEVVVVGAGHAGCEAAHATARLGLETLVVTLRVDRIGWMSCNPAVGGMAKGHLVREIDALGGLMGEVTDRTGIQFRTLNTRRGPAVRGTRVQVDRRRYAREMARLLLGTPSVAVRPGMVTGLVLEGRGGGRRVVGVRLEDGSEIRCQAVIVTAGTFLNGLAHVGEASSPCGREGDRAAVGLSTALSGLGLALGRFKTGTTPRLDGRTVDWARLAVQPGDARPRPMSHWTDLRRFPVLPQRPCHVTGTTPETHRLVRGNLGRSPLFTGTISGIGPRYCPSIEDKVHRFGDRPSHPVYLEPDGLDTDEVYPGGISTSLPAEVQVAMLRTIPGLETVELLRPGYAIEYDYVPPTQIDGTLSVRGIGGLYLAGQVNGTSGYEEAAAQGIFAGLNAGRWVRGEGPVRIRRDQAYLGVLVDDLTTVGTREPYRMFTSRAEHRLRLREDNADLRLSGLGLAMGLLDDDRAARAEARRRAVAAEVARLEATRAEGQGAPETLATMLRRPGVAYGDLASGDPGRPILDRATARTVEVEVKYRGYLERAERRLAALDALDETEIPDGFPFGDVGGLSGEVREKLVRHRPRTLGQAGRISGVTPAAVDLLAVHLLRAVAGRSKACG